jgi:hypothetical protein
LKDPGAGVAHNPTSNLKLGSGITPVAKMLEIGIPVGMLKRLLARGLLIVDEVLGRLDVGALSSAVKLTLLTVSRG